MAERTRRRRERREPVEVEEVEIDVEETTEEDEEDVVEVPQKRNLRNQPTRRRPRVVTPDPEEAEDEEEEEAPPAPPTPPVRTRARRSRDIADAETVNLEEKAQEPAVGVDTQPEPYTDATVPAVSPPGDNMVFDSIVKALLAALQDGLALVVTPLNNGALEIVATPQEKSAAKKASRANVLTGNAYWQEVLTPEFREHEREWLSLSLDERKKEAKKLKVKWEPHDNPKVDAMNMTTAVRAKLGIEKYKPQYQSQAARKLLREG